VESLTFLRHIKVADGLPLSGEERSCSGYHPGRLCSSRVKAGAKTMGREQTIRGAVSRWWNGEDIADSSRAVNALSDVLGRPAIGPFEDLPRRDLTARPKEAS
jgi:hypothetical protein